MQDTKAKGSWQVFGHQKAKDVLNRQLASGNLPHAYLFSGSQGLGKKLLGLEFAKKVLNTEKLENHPDFRILDNIEGEITMEPLLVFMGSLGYKPFFGKKKIAIINNADNLNLQASNALLKTLEEPSQSTIIILIAGSTGLLPTIISRCQVLSFSVFGQKTLEDFAKVSALEINGEIARLSFGRPARLKRLATDNKFLQEQKQLVESYEKIKLQTFGEKLAGLNNLAQKEASEIQDSLLTWLFWQAGCLAQRPEDFTKVHALSEAILGLKRNFNKKLVLQGLMMKI